MSQLLNAAIAGGYAVPSFAVWNLETTKLVLSVAERMKAPIILMSAPAEFSVLPPEDLGPASYALMKRFNVVAALHLDHGDSLDIVSDCLDAGYTSVMLDFSARPFEENAGALKKVVEMARPRGVTVEGEIGKVGRADDATREGVKESTLTEPADAVEFVRRTGVDTLAVSIGNAHGKYSKLPKLDFDRLGKIYAATRIPLVLHGGSGTPPEDLRRAISLGIAKVNVATDLVTPVRESLLAQWKERSDYWTPLAMGKAVKTMVPAVEKWIRQLGAEGRA